MSRTTPTVEEVYRLAERGNLIPIYRDIIADMETPVSAYLKTAEGPYSFLLESVEGGERWARYSFIGSGPSRVIKVGGPGEASQDPLIPIEAEMRQYALVPVPGLPRFTGGAVGYVSWEAVRYFEPRVPQAQNDVHGLPEAVFMLADTLLIFDHFKHKISIVSHVHTEGDIAAAYQEAVAKIDEMERRLMRPLNVKPQPAPEGSGGAVNGNVTSNLTREYYDRMLERAKEYIVAGDIIQVVLSQRFSRPLGTDPFTVYRALRTVNPSPYMYYLHLDDFDIVGASPELLVRVEDGHIDYHPIAGTRRRGATPEEDAHLEADLRHDEKEQAEHIMLVDLGRNDVGRVSKPGTVRVTQLLDVERYSHVMHLVSHVQGDKRDDLTAYDVLRSCFPAGTVAGAPKIRAMEIIAELEPDRRGPYAGCVGYISYSGNLDTCITLRTMVAKNGVATVQAGGGIVYDSQTDAEYQETINKAMAMMRAIAEAERMAAE